MAPPPTTPHGLPLSSPTSSTLSSWLFTGLHQLQNRLLHSEQANADAEVQVSTLIMERDAAISDARKLNRVRQAATADVTKRKACAQTKAQELEAGKAELEKVKGEKQALATASRTAQEAKVEAERALRERDAELDVCKAEVLLMETGLEQMREERDGAREATAAAETKLVSGSLALAIVRGCHKVTVQSLEERRDEIAVLTQSCESKSANAFVLQSKLEDVEDMVAQLGAQKAELVQDRRQMAVALAVSEQCRLPLVKQHRAGVEALYQNISQTARLQAKSDLQRAAIDGLVRYKAGTIDTLARADAKVRASRVDVDMAERRRAEAQEATGSIAQRLERQSAEASKLRVLLKQCQEENAEVHGIQQRDAAALAASRCSMSKARAERDASRDQLAALSVRTESLAINGRKLHAALTKHTNSAVLLSCLFAHQSHQSLATASAYSDFFLELSMSEDPTALIAAPYRPAERCKPASPKDEAKTQRTACVVDRSALAMMSPANTQLPSPITPPPAIMTQPARVTSPTQGKRSFANPQVPSPTTPWPAVMTHQANSTSPTKATMQASPSSGRMPKPAVVIETVASAAVSPDPRQRAQASVAAALAPTASMSAGVQKRRSSSVFVPRPMKRVRVDSKA
ncbi:hypothetical protein LTR53_017113 [Teratosphaeriaceae sp. CCFEE 6253]|nr:hypothetical protein LTR53_017113 [Teratosphaeriaceae sp. CCFEE 6253]